MLVPLSWLKEFVEIDIPAELLAERMTLAGLEVGGLTYIGLPQGKVEGVRFPKSDHLVWNREKIVLGAIREVKPHPDADRLVLAMVDHGVGELEQTVTGAPNLFEYRGKGPLEKPLWTAFAREGAEVWDGHSETPQRMILKEKKLRGIPNRCMVCSEKELGIYEEHEGIMLLDDPGKPPGTPLQDVLGDVLFNIELTPNLARCYSILGVAREVAALLGKPVRYPSFEMTADGPTIEGEVAIEIQEPELNPRFTLTLLRNTKVQPSPRWMQYRLRLVGQRPINNIVDVTNYLTFEIGQPLHAFDYDKLKARAGKKTPTIITRLPKPGETLATLDEKTRQLEPHNILVCDSKGVLSLGGVIGGAETEISDSTTNVLLEAANWNFINIRRTMQSQKVNTDAGLRFSRGVHPSQSILGVKRGIEMMRQTGGGSIAQGVIDHYPRPAQAAEVQLPIREIKRLLGIEISIEKILDILWWLEFKAELVKDVLHVVAPDYRTDIGSGVIGQADLIEEIARINGYDNMYDTIIADEMPPQWANTALEREERARDVLVALGLRETISYRLTTPERELALTPQGMGPSSADHARLWDRAAYVELANPLTPERAVMRHTLLSSLIENAITNQRSVAQQRLFEIGQVYFKWAGAKLPDEHRRLGLLLSGARRATGWTQDEAPAPMDFFDLKAAVEGLLEGLHIQHAAFRRSVHPSLHPGRSACLLVDGQPVGDFGELHPLVARQIEWEGAPLYLGEFDLDGLLADVNANYPVKALATTPPVLQDIALVMGDEVESARVEAVIRQAGGDLLKGLTLFDVYRGDPIPAGQKSLAYSLTYRADDRTLTDKEVATVHQKIVKTVERELGAKLRG